MPQITGTLSSSGDSAALIEAGASQCIQVWGLQLYIVDSAITVTVKTGSTAKFTCGGAATVTVSVEPPSCGKEPILQGAKGEDLLINLSGAGSVRYSIQYVLGGL